MTDREKIENILKLYPLIRSKCKINIIKSKEKAYSLPAINYLKAAGGETNAFYSSVETFVADKTDLDIETAELVNIINAVIAGLKCLTKRERLSVIYKYFSGLTDIEAAAEIDRSRTTIQNYRKSALIKLEKANLHKIWSKYEQIFTTLLEKV